MKKFLVAAVLSVAAFAPVPAEAIAVRPCDAGYTGVTVEDARGRLVVVCVRTS